MKPEDCPKLDQCYKSALNVVFLTVNTAIGFWLAGSWAAIFYWLKDGYSVREPNAFIATVEFYVACLVSLWFLGQIGYWLVRAVRK